MKLHTFVWKGNIWETFREVYLDNHQLFNCKLRFCCIALHGAMLYNLQCYNQLVRYHQKLNHALPEYQSNIAASALQNYQVNYKLRFCCSSYALQSLLFSRTTLPSSCTSGSIDGLLSNSAIRSHFITLLFLPFLECLLPVIDCCPLQSFVLALKMVNCSRSPMH